MAILCCSGSIFGRCDSDKKKKMMMDGGFIFLMLLLAVCLLSVSQPNESNRIIHWRLCATAYSEKYLKTECDRISILLLKADQKAKVS